MSAWGRAWSNFWGAAWGALTGSSRSEVVRLASPIARSVTLVSRIG